MLWRTIGMVSRTPAKPRIAIFPILRKPSTQSLNCSQPTHRQFIWMVLLYTDSAVSHIYMTESFSPGLYGREPVNIVLRGTAYLKRTLTSMWRIFFKDTISILTREQHFWLLITNHFWIFITRINIGNWKCQIIENRTSPHNINQWHVVSSRKWNWAELKRVHPHSSERELCLPWSIDISFSTIFVAKN